MNGSPASGTTLGMPEGQKEPLRHEACGRAAAGQMGAACTSRCCHGHVHVSAAPAQTVPVQSLQQQYTLPMRLPRQVPSCLYRLAAGRPAAGHVPCGAHAHQPRYCSHSLQCQHGMCPAAAWHVPCRSMLQGPGTCQPMLLLQVCAMYTMPQDASAAVYRAMCQYQTPAKPSANNQTAARPLSAYGHWLWWSALQTPACMQLVSMDAQSTSTCQRGCQVASPWLQAPCTQLPALARCCCCCIHSTAAGAAPGDSQGIVHPAEPPRHLLCSVKVPDCVALHRVSV